MLREQEGVSLGGPSQTEQKAIPENADFVKPTGLPIHPSVAS